MTYIEVCLKNPTAGRGDAMPRGESRVLLGDTSEVRGEISAACGDPVMMLERGVWWLVGLWVFFFVPVMALDRAVRGDTRVPECGVVKNEPRRLRTGVELLTGVVADVPSGRVPGGMETLLLG